jgi:rSAM-associated Gly-rich repeat protein
LSVPRKYLTLVSHLMNRGTIGIAVLLGAAAPAAAAQEPASARDLAAQEQRVSERLAAIREAVSVVSETETSAVTGEQRLAWHNWGNGGGWGWGRPWANFNFGLPWNNWNNWRNGWHNWRNGWGNW